MTVTLPIRLVSVANAREHWSKKAARARDHRGAARLVVASNKWKTWADHPLTVTLTRVAPRMLDSDNLSSAFKALRDGVADALGVNDNDGRISWRYDQQRGRIKEYAVRITIEAA